MGRLIVLVLEGATPELVDRYAAAGHLPCLSEVTRRGTVGRYVAGPVPYECPELLSAFTGAATGEHGCLTYWSVHGPTFGAVPEPIAGDRIGIPFLWERPEARPAPVAIVNVFGTDPPRPVNGRTITYPLHFSLRPCHPRDLLRELARAGIEYCPDTHSPYTDRYASPREYAQVAHRLERERMRACLLLLDQGADLAVFDLTLVDRLSHFLWHEVEEGSGLAPADTCLWAAYGLADWFVGEVLSRLADGDELVAFSEIGFGPMTDMVSIDEALAGAGLAVVRPDGAVDVERSLAMEAAQGANGVNLSLRRRYPDGRIAPAEEAAVSAEARSVLLALRDGAGRPCFRDVVPGPELYPGSRADRAPDLVFLPAREGIQSPGHWYWARRMLRRRQTGWHRRESFWAGFGGRFTGGGRGLDASAADVAHTVAAFLGLPPPAAGRALAADAPRSLDRRQSL